MSVTDSSYAAVMARRNAIMKASLGIDYDDFVDSPIAFDYERMMAETGYSHDDIARIQRETKVGNTPLVELRNLTEAVRRRCEPGKGATILLKDEAANASGSFKARRASISAYEAARKGYEGVIAATSGNYGAAVASQAAQRGLKCIIVQEVFDSRGVGQPEIVEKSRACEAYGAEVLKMSVGPELFYMLLRTLEETGYFNASLYTPFGVRGVETLGLRDRGRRPRTAWQGSRRRGHHPRRRRQPDRHGPRSAGRALRSDPYRRLLRRPEWPAHGVRPRLQP